MIRESHDHYRRSRYRDIGWILWFVGIGVLIGFIIGWSQPGTATGEPGIYPGPISQTCISGQWVVQVDPVTVVTLPIVCVEP